MAIDKRLIFYEGKHVLLKVLATEDVAESDWVSWFNDVNMSDYNQHHYHPVSFDQQNEFLKSCNTPTKIQLGIVDRNDDARICGVVSLNSINWIHRHADIAGIQDAKTGENVALFFEAWSLMIRHGFEQLGLQKIYGGTFHPHVVRALVETFNFEVEGVRRREVFKNNGFKDVTLIAVFDNTVCYPKF